MNDKNNLLSKESLKRTLYTLSDATDTLIYDGNDTFEQIKAGNELLQAKWILAAICDHVYDYYPASYFMNEDDKKQYQEFLERFFEIPEKIVKNTLHYAKNNFSLLETITRDEYNQHRIPERKIEEEKHVLEVLEFVNENLVEFLQLLKMPKKVTDPNRPTDSEIKNLINTISKIQKMHSDYADNKGDSDLVIRVFEYNRMLELYKNPLLMAWQLYHYGWHSDFWEEGDSMMDYMMFETNAREMIEKLIQTLMENSPFKQYEKCSIVTNGLLHVYRHLLTQNLDNV